MKMKSILAGLLLLGSLSPAFSQLNIPSANGSDGPFNLPASPASVVIDLSQAIPGDALTSSNAGANQGKGIYDAARWVIVFKYSSVSIPAGVTVTFINHPSHAPVVWLVQGSVTIAGNVSLNGQTGATGPDAVNLTEPGPGGFRGGATGPAGAGNGLGPGGANVGATYNSSYGNPQILPLIGGSAAGAIGGVAGGGAGGAILIAAPGTLNITGAITSVGGNGYVGNYDQAGTGGAIKLIANPITGTGSLNAAVKGRVRVEANSLASTITTTPSTIAVG